MSRFIEAIVEHPVRSAVAATTAPVVALAINCGGGDNSQPTPDDIKSPTASVLITESPMPSQTDMATKVTEAPTPVITEAPTTAPTPEASPNDLIISSISFFEGPSPEGVDEVQWEAVRLNVLEGSEEQGGNHGLYDIKNAIELGNYTEANEMLSYDLFNKAVHVGASQSIDITTEEINHLDPERLLIPNEFAFYYWDVPAQNVATDLLSLKQILHS